MEHPNASPESIEISKDLMRGIVFGIEDYYDNPVACLGSVVQVYKDFTAGWQWTNHPKIAKNVTRSTSNVSPHGFPQFL